MSERSYAKKYILEELEKKDWRPSAIRSFVRGLKDLKRTNVPDYERARVALFFSARMYKTSISSILAKNRVGRNSWARQMISYYFYEKGVHEDYIAEWIGLDRTTVYRHWKKLSGEIEAGFKPTIKEVEKFKTLMEL